MSLTGGFHSSVTPRARVRRGGVQPPVNFRRPSGRRLRVPPRNTDIAHQRSIHSGHGNHHGNRHRHHRPPTRPAHRRRGALRDRHGPPCRGELPRLGVGDPRRPLRPRRDLAHLPLPGHPLGLGHGDLRLPLQALAAQGHARPRRGHQGVHPRRRPRVRGARAAAHRLVDQKLRLAHGPEPLRGHRGLGRQRRRPCRRTRRLRRRPRRTRRTHRAHHLRPPRPLRLGLLLPRARPPPPLPRRGGLRRRDHPPAELAGGPRRDGPAHRRHRLRGHGDHARARPRGGRRAGDHAPAQPQLRRPASRGRPDQRLLEPRPAAKARLPRRALPPRGARHGPVRHRPAPAVRLQDGAQAHAAAVPQPPRDRRALHAPLPPLGPARVQGAGRGLLPRAQRQRPRGHRHHRHVHPGRDPHLQRRGAGSRPDRDGHGARPGGLRRRDAQHRRRGAPPSRPGLLPRHHAGRPAELQLHRRLRQRVVDAALGHGLALHGPAVADGRGVLRAGAAAGAPRPPAPRLRRRLHPPRHRRLPRPGRPLAVALHAELPGGTPRPRPRRPARGHGIRQALPRAGRPRRARAEGALDQQRGSFRRRGPVGVTARGVRDCRRAQRARAPRWPGHVRRCGHERRGR